MSRVLIKNGRVVTAADDYVADVLIDNGRIRMIGQEIKADDAEVHDASGLLVLPGGVDVHTHLEMGLGAAMTVDTFETGTKSAAFGGTTTLVDYAKQDMGASPLAGLANWHERARGACVDVGAHIIMVDINENSLADVKTMIHSEGVSSFKMFMVRPGQLLVEDDKLYKIMRVTADNGGLSCVHAENGRLIEALIEESMARGHNNPKYHMLTRPSTLEGEASHRAIRIAELADAPLYVVHVSASEAVNAISDARREGIAIYAETCPHYLFLSDREYDRPDFEPAKYVMSPPLRPEHHREAMWRALRTNDLQIVSTDHCPFCFHEQSFGLKYSKELGRDNFTKIPNGAPGVETRMSLIYNGGVRERGMSLNRFVEMTATAPARLFGLYPRKGTIAIGSDGDVVLFNPDERWTIRAAEQHSRADYTLFEGFEVAGRVKKVFLRGNLIVDGDKWLGRKGGGEFLRRSASGNP
jgi:dihydropyrimidinase